MSNDTATAKRAPGRPPVPGSTRQQKIAEREERIANGTLKKGRPVSGVSKRQQKMLEREARIASGIPIKPGRPKMIKSEGEPQPAPYKAGVPLDSVTAPHQAWGHFYN
jgi:hypothetical protein